MTKKKKFLLKFAAAVVMLLAVQSAFYVAVGARRYINSRFLFERIDRCLEANGEVLYFGDSTTLLKCPNDSDLRSLFDDVQVGLEGIATFQVAHPAFSLTQYELMCRYIAGQPRRPRLLVIPVNIRSFSTSWDLRPDWQFPQQSLFVRNDGVFYRMFYEPLIKFHAPFFNMMPISMKDYLDAPVTNGTEVVGRVSDFYIDFNHPPQHADLRRQFVWCYMHSIQPEHRKSKSLREIARTARDAGMKVVFYVAPVDYESGMQYLGEAFSKRLDENVAALQSIAAQEGATIHDFSRLLPSGMFCPPSFMPDDHMNGEGRAILAEQIAAAVLEALKATTQRK